MKFEKNFSIAFFKERKPIWGVLESILITLFALWLAIKLHPQDPLFVSGPFPWICLASVLCSLVYGALNGAISLAVLLLYLVVQQDAMRFDSYFLREYVVGISGLTILCGIFSSYWLGRIRHVEYLNRYVREHLDDLSREYYLLRISHERLEHAYITKPLSFRDAFYQIKQEILKNNCEINSAISQQLLNIFSQYCSINSAAFCLYDSTSNQASPLSYIGKSFFINLNDPLVNYAINKHSTAYSAVNALEGDESSDYLAVIPMLNENRRLIGLIIIKEMPFWSLTHDNLEVLSVFAATFALQLSSIRQVDELVKQFPGCDPEFLLEFKSLVFLKKHHKVESGLSGILVPEGFFQENIIYSLRQQKRSLDSIWVLPMKSAQLFLTIMPITGLEGMYGYRRRLVKWLKGEFGQEINKKGVIYRYHQLNDLPVEQQLNEFIKEFTYAE